MHPKYILENYLLLEIFSILQMVLWDKKMYDCLTANGFNSVLQVPYLSPNSTLTDDGSLSVYSAMHGKPYVNTEAAAACCSEGTAVINQLMLLDHLTTQVAQ